MQKIDVEGKLSRADVLFNLIITLNHVFLFLF